MRTGSLIGFLLVNLCLEQGVAVSRSLARADDVGSQAVPSLARLLNTPPPRPDDALQLTSTLAQLEKRPLAQLAAPALEEARTALASLPTLRADGAPTAVLERRKQRAWSALLWADRVIARAELAAALRELSLRADRAAAEAQTARTRRDGVPANDRVCNLAPDLSARAERARREAALVHEAVARGDADRVAQLLQLAAEAEADRVLLEREADSTEQRMAADVNEQAEADRVRLRAEQQRELSSSAARELVQAGQVFAALDSASAAARLPAARIADFLTRRASLRLSAAIALGADGPELADAEARLQTVQATHASVPRVALAEAALSAAERALGAARKHASAVRPEQTGDLLARARERGFRAAASPSGVAIQIVDAFAVGHREPRAEQRAHLRALRELLSAFPHGSIRIACAARGAKPEDLELARTRAAHLVDWFSQTIERTRLIADVLPPSADSADVQVILAAYVEQPTNTAVTTDSDPR